MDCASKFEQDLVATPGVSRVTLNFGAAKLTIEGPISPHMIAEIGRKHNVRIALATEPIPQQSLWAANPHLLSTAIAGAFLMAGWVLGLGREGWFPTVAYAAAIVIGGWSPGKKGLRSLVRLNFNMNVLMFIAVIGAALIGEWGEGATVVFLFGISETLEAYSVDRARQSIRSLMEMAPKMATVRRNGQEQTLPVEEIQVGDLILVRPGEKIGMDGQVISGSSAVDQAAITGESLPVLKQVGDEVFAGTLNGSGALIVTVTKLVEDSTFSRIVHLVEEAQAQRAPTQTLVERFAKLYTPAVMLITALIMLVPPLLLGLPWLTWIYRGLALLVVACPCALLISTPVSIVSAISTAARHGVLIKGGAHLEQIGKIQAIAFDKTGTLTTGRPEVTNLVSFVPAYSPAQVLSLAAAVEAHSEHPLARAIVTYAERGEGAPAATDFQALVGQGAHAMVEGHTFYVGSPRLFRDHLGVALGNAAEQVAAWESQGQTVVLIGDAVQVLGAIAVADTPRQTSAPMVASLKASGIQTTVMLTGDNSGTANAIAKTVGIGRVEAELMPQDKVAAVQALVTDYGAVAMVGDGVNDAPALAAATVGIAMGGAGTNVALETADIALMADDLSKLPFTIALSQATFRIIKQNIAISLGLKLLALLAVFPGWLTLWIAILSDMGATLIVTLNALRLLGLRPATDQG